MNLNSAEAMTVPSERAAGWIRGMRRMHGLGAAGLSGLALLLAGAAASGESAAPGTVLRSTSAIRDISLGQAAKGYRVDFVATVTYYDPVWRGAFVQDGKTGVYVDLRESSAPPLRRGDRVRIKGTTNDTGYTPLIGGQVSVIQLGRGTMPAPQRLSVSELLMGDNDTDWVETTGVVQSVGSGDRHVQLLASSGIVGFTISLPEGTRLPEAITGSRIRVRGACSVTSNSRLQAIGIQIMSPGAEAIHILSTGGRPAAVQTGRIADLLQYRRGANVGRMVQVGGVVTAAGSSEIYMQDETGGIRVTNERLPVLHTGDKVVARGYPSGGNFSSTLRLAQVESSGEQVDVQSPLLPAEQLAKGAKDAVLVTTRALLVGSFSSARERMLHLRSGSVLFKAVLRSAGLAPRNDLHDGSLVEVTGVCSMRAESTNSDAFEILLRSDGDVKVLETPSWWTPGRMAAVLALFAASGFAVSLWVIVLRRKIRQQTAVIARELEIEKELKLAAERAQDELEERVEERTRELQAEVAEREAIGQKLLAAKQAAEESNRAKSTFLANMSHELRTPLNAIIGYSEMLREDAVDRNDAVAVADLQKIGGAGHHLLALINDILDISKIEAGRVEMHIEPVLVSSLVRDVTQTIEPIAQDRGNRLVVRTEYQGTVNVDAVRFRQSLLNLLSNACKFTENGTVELEVRENSERDRDWVEWHVRDTGIGIAEEDIPKLFREFSQVDASTTRKYGGTGLGLAISQRFCQMMGGHIGVRSVRGEGSEFTIHIPQN